MSGRSTVEDEVSLVILSHNRRMELDRTLAHTRKLHECLPVIVVDNGSTDDTTSFVRQRYPEVTLISTGCNLGAAGRNLGVNQVRTPLVAFSDDDTWWEPGALRHAAQIFSSHSELGVLNATVLVGPEARTDPCCLQMQRSPLPEFRGVGPSLAGFMAGASVMRAEAYRQAGGYWPLFFIGGEEELMAIDILEAGWKIAYCPEIRVHHWPSQLRDSKTRRHLTARNAVWTALLRLPWSMALKRSHTVLTHVPETRRRIEVINETAFKSATLLANRRVARETTCSILHTVWAEE